jgi:8-oxo-dGTP pyrophosphatase MutT (NUDIX family)
VCGVGELVERVDEQDRVLGVVERDEAIRHGWLHRIATTVCRDQHRLVLVYRRAEGLSRFPGKYDVMFGGAVSVEESYAVAAARELYEELGVDAPVRLVCKFLCHGVISPYWLGVHEAVVSGEIAPDPQEIAWHGWLAEAELRDAVQRWHFVPDGQEAFKQYLSSCA